MKIITIAFGYLKWHYSKALKSLINIWQNFLVFLFQFFSIKLLLKNFFDPWKRMADPYPKSFSFKDYFFAFIINLIVRLVGILMRLCLLIIGLSTCLLFCILLPIILIIWFVLPAIIIFMLGTALYLIIK